LYSPILPNAPIFVGAFFFAIVSRRVEILPENLCFFCALLEMAEEIYGAGARFGAIRRESSTQSSGSFKSVRRRNASLLRVSRDFLISTATATTTVFILPIKQGRVALRTSSRVCAFQRRKSGDGIQCEEI
jgi:hypothetical protein